VEELRQLELSRSDPGALAQAAVALHHGYGAIESALERVARSIEGSLPTGRDWHLAFRHFFRHAYAVSLEAPRLDALRSDMLALRALLERDLDALDEHLARVATEPA
jgi:hypothetical protein